MYDEPVFFRFSPRGKNLFPRRTLDFVRISPRLQFFSEFFDHPPNQTGIYCVVMVAPATFPVRHWRPS